MTRAQEIETAAQAVVDAYPVAAGTIPTPDTPEGYGSIRALREALARPEDDHSPGDSGDKAKKHTDPATLPPWPRFAGGNLK